MESEARKPGAGTAAPDGMKRAIVENRVSEVRHMLDSGRDPDGMIGTFTPLILAVTEGRAGIVDMLLERGANPSGRADVTRMSPLHAVAISSEKPECVEIAKSLLLHESNPNAVDGRGFRPLDFLTGDSLRVARMRRLLESRGGRRGDRKAIEKAHLMEADPGPEGVRFESVGEFSRGMAGTFAELMDGILMDEIVDPKDERLDALGGKPIVHAKAGGVWGRVLDDPDSRVAVVASFDMIAETLVEYGARDPLADGGGPGRGLAVSKAQMASIREVLSSLAREFVYKEGESYAMFGNKGAVDEIVGFKVERP